MSRLLRVWMGNANEGSRCNSIQCRFCSKAFLIKLFERLAVRVAPSELLVSMHIVVSCCAAATTSWPVVKSIHHLLKASTITHIGSSSRTDSGDCYPVKISDQSAAKTHHRKYTVCFPPWLHNSVPGLVLCLYLPS